MTRRVIMRRAGAERAGTVRLEPCGHVVEAAGEWRQRRRCRACEEQRARGEREWILTGQSELARQLRRAQGLPEPTTTQGKDHV